jgi:hypothetical protein
MYVHSLARQPGRSSDRESLLVHTYRMYTFRSDFRPDRQECKPEHRPALGAGDYSWSGGDKLLPMY